MPTARDPDNLCQLRLSEMPGFVPWKPGDPFPEQLRKELNVEAFVRELRRIVIEQAAQSDKSDDLGNQ